MISNELNDFDRALLEANKIGASSLVELFDKERDITDIRILELKQKSLPGKFDFDYLKKIHSHIFGDVYKTAGKDRYELGIHGMFVKENIGGGGETMFTHGLQIPKASKRLFESLKEKNFFHGFNEGDFVHQSARFFSELNMLHPFREGNGRTQRIFMENLAQQAGFVLDLGRVSAEQMIIGCQEASRGFPVRLEILFRQNLKPYSGYIYKEEKRGLKEVVSELTGKLKAGLGIS